MNWTIQTGTDSEGNPVTTTLDVQWNWTYEYVSHETRDFVENNVMPQRRTPNMVKQVAMRVTGTDTTTANATHLLEGQSDQTHSEIIHVALAWRHRASGESVSGFFTPYQNVTETQMLNWAKDIMAESDKAMALETGFATSLYGEGDN
jgi:hypothetical protein